MTPVVALPSRGEAGVSLVCVALALLAALALGAAASLAASASRLEAAGAGRGTVVLPRHDADPGEVTRALAAMPGVRSARLVSGSALAAAMGGAVAATDQPLLVEVEPGTAIDARAMRTLAPDAVIDQGDPALAALPGRLRRLALLAGLLVIASLAGLWQAGRQARRAVIDREAALFTLMTDLGAMPAQIAAAAARPAAAALVMGGLLGTGLALPVIAAWATFAPPAIWLWPTLTVPPVAAMLATRVQWWRT